MKNKGKLRKDNKPTWQRKDNKATGQRKGIKIAESEMNNERGQKSRSRSRSGTRRSLSSLFRRSAAQAEYYDKGETTSNDMENNAQNVNPRTEPRVHLQRMTVREALEYSRQRGRSPGKRTLKLEQIIFGDESRMSRGSICSSLPDFLNPETNVVKSSVDNKKLPPNEIGSTLPRVKKRFRADFRQNSSNTTEALIPRRSIGDDILDLPLDKRKRSLIHDIHSDEIDNSVAIHSYNLQTNNASHVPTHSVPSIVGMFPSAEIDNKHRESLNQFMQLTSMTPVHTNQKLPNHGEENVDYGHDLVNIAFRSSLVNAGSKALTNANLDDHTFAKVFDERSPLNLITDLDKSFIPISSTLALPQHENSRNSQHLKAVNIENIQQNASEKKDEQFYSNPNGSFRQSHKSDAYVSPRTFNSHSTASAISSKVDDFEKLIDASTKDESTQNEKQKRVNVSIDHHSGKYNRSKFSKINRMVSHIDGVKTFDKETSTDSFIYKVVFTDSSTQTADDTENGLPNLYFQKTKTKPMNTDTSEISDEQKLQYFGDSNVNRNELDQINDTNIDRDLSVNTTDAMRQMGQKQGCKLIQSNEKIPVDRTTPAKYIFADVNFVGKIQQVCANVPLQQEPISETRTDSSKTKEKLKTIAPENTKQIHEIRYVDTIVYDLPDNLGKDTLSYSKKGKRKSKKKAKEKEITCSTENQKGIEESVADNEILERAVTANKGVPKAHNIKAVEKFQSTLRSILRKPFKQKHKSVQEALIKIGKAASLSNICDSQVSSFHDEHRPRRHSDSLTISRRLEKDQNITYMNEIQKVQTKPSFKVIQGSNRTDMITQEKSRGKLSLASIVAIKSKISRKSKITKQDKCSNLDSGHKNAPKFTSDSVEECTKASALVNSEGNDTNVAKICYENEINSSIGKQSDSLSELIEECDKEIKKFIYDKKIQFEAYCDPISEEEFIKQRQRNTRLTSRRESKIRQRQKKVINCCKTFIAFLFSHIGLCSLVIAYCIMGGFIFKELEGQKEIETKREMTNVRENYTERIYRLAFETAFTKASREEFRLEVNAILKNFSSHVHRQTKDAGWDGKDVAGNGTSSEPEQWSLPSSLLYAITVMTTIGYGHVAPKTDEGRIMTIAYAVLGIPLTLLCLTNIGDVMAQGFRMLYGKVCCGICCILFSRRRRRCLDQEKGIPVEEMVMHEEEKSEEVVHVPTSVCLLLMTAYIMLGTLLFSNWENWDAVTGTYFCFITLSTIGFGDVVPGVGAADWNIHEKLVSCALYLIFGLSLIAMCFNLVQEDVKAKCKWLGMKLGIIDKPVSNV